MTTINAAIAAHFVYIDQLAQPIGNLSKATGYAEFYTGEAQDVEVRHDEHLNGKGAKMLAYAASKGIQFSTILVIGCDSAETAKLLEKLIKNGGGVRRQLPRLQRLAEKVVTMDDLKARGRKDPKAVVEKRQQRLNAKAEKAREAAANATPFDQVYADSVAAPIDTRGPIYTPGIPAYLFAAENCNDDWRSM